MVPVALTVAGSDPSGGAGIQADTKTFHQHGCYGCAVVTLLTVQNTRRLDRIEVVSPDLVAGQLRAVLEDMQPGAGKTGALGSAGVVEAVAEAIGEHPLPLVVDPVLASKQGAVLIDDTALRALQRYLLPRALLVAPNLDEAEVLAGRSARDRQGIRDAARAIADLGSRAVIIKGGHLSGDAIDTLYHEGEFVEFSGTRVDARHTHGVGCAFSAAITAGLAKGKRLVEAVAEAKTWIGRAIASAPGIGGGVCAVDHHAPVGEAPDKG
jgi:hydroxymethylpyrimidine/phosphomethylpyrimidine kinase